MWESVGVTVGYVAISFLYFGIRVLPDPSRELIGTGADPQIFVWSFAWWPHALGNGESPFVTRRLARVRTPTRPRLEFQHLSPWPAPVATRRRPSPWAAEGARPSAARRG